MALDGGRTGRRVGAGRKYTLWPAPAPHFPCRPPFAPSRSPLLTPRIARQDTNSGGIPAEESRPPGRCVGGRLRAARWVGPAQPGAKKKRRVGRLVRTQSAVADDAGRLRGSFEDFQLFRHRGLGPIDRRSID